MKKADSIFVYFMVQIQINWPSKWPAALERICFLSPMWPKDQCTFVADNLPKFDKHEIQKQLMPPSAEEVRI